MDDSLSLFDVAIEAPQSEQNLTPLEFSYPHSGQVIVFVSLQATKQNIVNKTRIEIRIFFIVMPPKSKSALTGANARKTQTPMPLRKIKQIRFTMPYYLMEFAFLPNSKIVWQKKGILSP